MHRAAVICRDDTECGTLVVRVEPAAEIFVDDRSMGTTTALELRLSAGRHRIRLETDAWRFPQVVEIATGATGEIDVDLEQEDSPDDASSAWYVPAQATRGSGCRSWRLACRS